MDNKFRNSTRAYVFGSGQKVAVTATSASSTALTASEVLLTSTTNCYITTGATAAAAAGNFYLSAGIPFHLQVVPGGIISVVRDSADGSLYILPVA